MEKSKLISQLQYSCTNR